MRGCPHPKTDPRPYLCPLPSFRHKTQFTIRSIFWDDCVGKGGYFWFQFQGCFTCFALQIDYHLLAAFNSLFPHTSQHDGHEDKSRIKESTFTRLKVSSSVVKGKNLTFDQKRVMSTFWNQFRGENKIGELGGLQVASYLRICSCIELKLLQAEARPGSHCCHSLALRLAIRPTKTLTAASYKHLASIFHKINRWNSVTKPGRAPCFHAGASSKGTVFAFILLSCLLPHLV